MDETKIIEKLDRIEKSILLSQKRFLTFSEGCTYCSYSESYMYKLTSSHRIPHLKPNGKIYFDRFELDKWLSKNTIRSIDDIEEEALRFTQKKKKA